MKQKYPRQCGDCKECCTHVAVQELDKPAGTPCKNLCKIGCSIYKDRPDACRKFVCCWYQGEFSVNDRPDKTGTVCWLAKTGIQLGSDGNEVYALFVSHRKKLTRKTKEWMMEQSYRFPVIQTPMRGNSLKGRKIWWQGKRLND